MSTKPILFNTDMVRALLVSRKTVTRRVVRPQPKDWSDDLIIHSIGGGYITATWLPSEDLVDLNLPYRPGDILYVRETFCINNFGYHYRADWPGDNCPDMSADDKWRPSIHMPREAARIFLRVTDVWVERLQDITNDDLVRDFGFCLDAIKALGRDALAGPLWDSTIKPADRDLYGWEANPLVWVIEFERISKEEVKN